MELTPCLFLSRVLWKELGFDGGEFKQLAAIVHGVLLESGSTPRRESESIDWISETVGHGRNPQSLGIPTLFLRFCKRIKMIMVRKYPLIRQGA
ncbi:hypothetical protein L484_011537 [Morus notabilis]|uniref:Uncharacterized protein n=1 Tax=Morus notabilis TaxID=981085 RepID=W9S256_9ROSA|nr:hypothetical protein L484_011537 [Morus notabilis]